MAVFTNLTTASDNLSGFDPVDGISDGTAVGKTYVMWKLFDALRTFDDRITLITSESATTLAWMTASSANIQSEPVITRATINDKIRFYMSNDTGLSASLPSAVVYEWWIYNSTSYYGNFGVSIGHIISGSTYVLDLDRLIANIDNTLINNAFYWLINTATTTVMNNIPKAVFWKSSNATALIAISKADNTFRGGYVFGYPDVVSGYRETTGSLVEGENVQANVSFNFAGGCTFVNHFGATKEGSLTILSSTISILGSVGYLPTQMLVYSSSNHMMFGKFRFSCVELSGIPEIEVTEELEGLYFTNSTNATLPSFGGIAQYGTNYYISMGNNSDGRITHRLFLDLGTGSA